MLHNSDKVYTEVFYCLKYIIRDLYLGIYLKIGITIAF